ncbi:MAG: Lrp/AsnC family transcriptional regulator [Thomasclavelia sp.]|jgi:DNA-binding Lrp family transcriptional regulator|nr:Lrp/AsnC family transcriptional regulator [Thomasclavelia sp.]
MDENLLLSLLKNNARLEVTDLAAALNASEQEVENSIKDLEKRKVICGYHTLINYDKTNDEEVLALIQIDAAPEREYGYDRVAKTIYNFEEIDTLYLLSGSHEFMAMIKGRTMQEVARFVGSKLAPLDGVTATATLFVLKQYKHNGVIFDETSDKSEERLVVTP